MKRNLSSFDARQLGQKRTAESVTPLDVFYVVDSIGPPGKRDHKVRSVLFEKRTDAEAELARLRAADPNGTYDVWHAATYIEPAAWAYDVLLADGSLIHPQRTERSTRRDARRD